MLCVYYLDGAQQDTKKKKNKEKKLTVSREHIVASLFLLPNTMSYLLAGRLCAATLCRVPRRPMSCKMS